MTGKPPIGIHRPILFRPGVLFPVDEDEIFLEDEGDGVVGVGAEVVEGVFLADFQACHDGGHFGHAAHAIGTDAVLLVFIHLVMDDIPIDGCFADDFAAGFDDAVQHRVRAGDAQVSVFVFQGEQGFVRIARSGARPGPRRAPRMGKVLAALHIGLGTSRPHRQNKQNKQNKQKLFHRYFVFHGKFNELVGQTKIKIPGRGRE